MRKQGEEWRVEIKDEKAPLESKIKGGKEKYQGRAMMS